MKTRIYLVLSLIVAGFGMLSAQPAYFTRIANGPTDADHSWGGSLLDYDNDGLVDLFAANWPGYNCLYHNDGNFQFSKVTTEPVVKVYGECATGVCADFDNDGFLDLFVVNYLGFDFHYHNEGNGTFTRIYDGDTVNLAGHVGCFPAWANLDNDGFLDLMVANDGPENGLGAPNDLWRNDAKANGNANGWLLVKLVGTAPNRSAIGAKIRAKATIWGEEVWQLREISGGNGSWGQTDLRAHFRSTDDPRSKDPVCHRSNRQA